MDPAEMARMMEKIMELRKKLSDGRVSPDEALKFLHENERPGPTSWEYGLFLIVITFIVLVFGKHRYRMSRHCTIFMNCKQTRGAWWHRGFFFCACKRGISFVYRRFNPLNCVP